MEEERSEADDIKHEDTVSDTPLEGDGPIDVEFEPAETGKRDTQPIPAEKRRPGPGWISLWLVGALAMVGGAGGGALAVRYIPITTSAETSDPSPDIRRLDDVQRQTDIRLSDLAKDLVDTEARLKRSFASLQAAGAAANTDDRTDEFTRLNERLSVLERDAGRQAPQNTLSRDAAGQLETLKALGEELKAGSAARVTALDALSVRLSEVEFAVEALRQVGGPSGEVPTGTIDDVRAELASLARAVSDAQAGQRASENATRAALQASQGAADVAIALASVEAAASRGRPFQLAFSRLSAVLAGDPVLETLRPIAAVGAPTHLDLMTSFDTAAHDAEVADKTANAGDSWAWLRGIFGDEFEIGRSGTTGLNTADILQRMRAALEAGDVTLALRLADDLHGPASEAIQPWQAAARRRVMLDDGLDALRLRLIRVE